LEVLVGATVIGIGVLQSESLVNRLLALIAHTRFAQPIQNAYQSSKSLLGWKMLAGATLLSVVSWFCECVALVYVLEGLGIVPTWLLLQQSTFIFAASTLFGLVSLLPGGLRGIRGIIEWLIDLDGADEPCCCRRRHHVDSLWHVMVWGVVGDYRAHVASRRYL
jgi:uncharacterized membrane protein YbhN (UPF0104 family)